MRITPSLAVLGDASALKPKEWNRGEPGEEMLWLHTTIGRHLTLTAPVYDDVRTDSTLDMTPEGSLGDLLASVGGTEEGKVHNRYLTKEEACPQMLCPQLQKSQKPI